MTITTTSTFKRTARLGLCFLIGAGALTACGDPDDTVAVGAGVGSSSPAAAYVSPDQADRAAMLAVRNAPKAYESPDQADHAAMLAVRNAKFSADAIERREAANELARSADLDLGTALARAAATQNVSAHASADALDRQSHVEKTSAHASADALEHWALSESER
jgi:hypothetical protein